MGRPPSATLWATIPPFVPSQSPALSSADVGSLGSSGTLALIAICVPSALIAPLPITPTGVPRSITGLPGSSSSRLAYPDDSLRIRQPLLRGRVGRARRIGGREDDGESDEQRWCQEAHVRHD